jgi:hypothetical protein
VITPLSKLTNMFKFSVKSSATKSRKPIKATVVSGDSVYADNKYYPIHNNSKSVKGCMVMYTGDMTKILLERPYKHDNASFRPYKPSMIVTGKIDDEGYFNIIKDYGVKTNKGLQDF